MNKKSAYINIDLFYKWLTEHFIALKPQVKVLLILDGHSSKKKNFWGYLYCQDVIDCRESVSIGVMMKI